VRFLVVLGAYLAATAVAWLTVNLVGDNHPLVTTLWADIAATVVIFAVSMAVRNASIYDPYWSVAPPVIAVAWLALPDAADGNTARQVLIVGLILLWGVRLTANWASTWRDLHQEDWRYGQLRAETQVPWWLVNLGGIQLMPTLVVFLGMLPVWPALTADRPLWALDVLAAAVTLAAVVLEATADAQLHRFAANPDNRGRIIDEGAWRYSRHPNYLGEIGFWWGLWLFGVAAAPGWWWTVAGPLAMVLLFVTVSVPLMDRRSLARRPGYAEHMSRVPALLPRRSSGD